MLDEGSWPNKKSRFEELDPLARTCDLPRGSSTDHRFRLLPNYFSQLLLSSLLLRRSRDGGARLTYALLGRFTWDDCSSSSSSRSNMAAALGSRMKGEWRHPAAASRDTAPTGPVKMEDVKRKVMMLVCF